MDKEESVRRIKFYGLNDHATFFNLKRVEEYLDYYSENKTDYTLTDIIELYNVLQFVENKIFSKDLSNEKRVGYEVLISKLKRSLSLFFNAINEANASSIITDINYDYKQDLLLLLSKHKLHQRILPSTLLAVLQNIDIGLSDILTNKEIVSSCKNDVRSLIMADHKNAEYLVNKYLEAKSGYSIYLPANLTSKDTYKLLIDYIDSGDANPNYLKLISESQVNVNLGLDAKLKLKAKRKYDSVINEMFSDKGFGVEFGCEVSISNNQEEPEISSLDGMIAKYSYSKKWLEENSTPEKTIKNFISLFGFVNKNMILTFPSYKSRISVLESLMSVKGEREYSVGNQFRLREVTSLSQTATYERFLLMRDDCLENVIAWFFNCYLDERLKINGFEYIPASKTSTYLEKSRHLFTEMESIIKQFTLYVENGEIDKELLSISSDPVRYHSIPSLVADKYMYLTDNKESQTVMYFLFSDQTGLGYINSSLNSPTLFNLLVGQKVKYTDFDEHQKPQVDKLISLGILEKADSSIDFRSKEQILVLKNLYDYEAVSYYRYPETMTSEIDEMIQKEWLVKKTSLLTTPEASYFNYVLNQQEFSNGYDLRNKYLHGSQSNIDGENAHYNTYIVGLKLMLALIIKIDDDFSIKKTRSHDAS
jgi:hypothetical protein